MTNYFYADRDWLLRKLDTAYSSSSSLGQNDAGTVCTIFGILAIGTHYAHLEAVHSGATDSNVHNPSNATPFTGESAGLAFYHQACCLLPDVITLASLESAQACLILAVFAMPLDASGLAWTYPMFEHRGQSGPTHQPQAWEDLSTLLGFSFQSS